MSEWRDIWKESIVANRKMSLSLEEGIEDFSYLFREYGDDGMLHFAMAEAYEFHNDLQNAVKHYQKAKELFPVEHWKAVADSTIQRIQSHKSAEQFYDPDIFEELLWQGFQKTYEFVYLDDFVRYVSLSAFSRASSEWPLSLVDFRTVLELQIKSDFPEIIEQIKEKRNKDFSLKEMIIELYNHNYIDKTTADLMHEIRKAGNLAAHDSETIEKDKIPNVYNFLEILKFFNELRKKQKILIYEKT